MRNVTFTADEHLIEKARTIARSQHKSLNDAFREWLVDYTRRAQGVTDLDKIYRQLSHVNAGRKFTREEMNERR